MFRKECAVPRIPLPVKHDAQIGLFSAQCGKRPCAARFEGENKDGHAGYSRHARRSAKDRTEFRPPRPLPERGVRPVRAVSA